MKEKEEGVDLIGSIILSYIGTSFVLWDFYPGNWPTMIRLSCLTVGISIFILVILLRKIKNYD